MDFQEFLKELNEGKWKEVDELEMQYYLNPEDKLRIVGTQNRVLLRLVRVSSPISEKIKKSIDKIKNVKNNG
jgi:hypothetical protein